MGVAGWDLVTSEDIIELNVAWLRPYVAAWGGGASSALLRRIEALEARVHRLARALAAEPQSAGPRPLAGQHQHAVWMQ